MTKIDDVKPLMSDDIVIETNSTETVAPIDHYNLIYIAMMIIGTGFLFPYNIMMSASDYYKHTWPDFDLAFYAPLAISISSPFMQLVNVKLHHRISYSSRIIVSFALLLVLCALFPLSAVAFEDKKGVSLAFAILIFFGVGIINAVLQNTVFALGANFPFMFTQALMAGNGWSGVFSSCARIFTKLVFATDDAGYRNGAYFYFSVASFFSLICILVYLFMIKNSQFTKFYFTDVGEKVETESERPLLIDNDATSINALEEVEEVEEQPSIIEVFHKVKYMAMHVLFTFFMTFLVFPGLLCSLDDRTFSLKDGWFPTLLVLQFNVCDLIGRTLPSYIVMFNADNIKYAVYSRFLLYPLFIIYSKSTFFNSSYYLIAVHFFFSVTNGYVSSLCMMFGPTLVNDKEKPQAGSIMSMFLVSGILFGSLFALISQQILKF